MGLMCDPHQLQENKFYMADCQYVLPNLGTWPSYNASVCHAHATFSVPILPCWLIVTASKSKQQTPRDEAAHILGICIMLDVPSRAAAPQMSAAACTLPGMLGLWWAIPWVAQGPAPAACKLCLEQRPRWGG